MLTMALKSLYCRKETDEVGKDEPYVLVTSVDTQPLIPSVEVIAYSFRNVSTHNLRTLAQPRAFWGPDGQPRDIDLTNISAIFVVAMMENDDGRIGAARSVVKGAAVASLAASRSLPRNTWAAALVRDIAGALELPTGVPNFDDRLGVKELPLMVSDISLARSFGIEVSKTLTFRGDGGEYTLTFVLRKEDLFNS
jgi:hypothetical protein